MSLAILVPVLGRPQNVEPLCDSIAAASPPCRVVFVADPDDLPEVEAIRERRLTEHRNIIDWLLHGSSYAAKINAGIAATREPFIFTGADDLRFHPGWFHAAHRKLSDSVGVVGTQDRRNSRVKRGEHATHLLVSRDYAQQGTIDEPGKLMHEGYRHNGCDVELVETAKSRGAWAFAEESVVEHLRPKQGASTDPTYRLGEETRKRDRELLATRRPLWMK